MSNSKKRTEQINNVILIHYVTVDFGLEASARNEA